VPLVPVTVTVKVPVEGDEQDSVDVWEAPSMMLVGLRVQVRPAGETVKVSVTVPVNPWSGATLIVEVPLDPALIATLVGLAVTLKSLIVYVTVAECDREPLVPVTVTV